MTPKDILEKTDLERVQKYKSKKTRPSELLRSRKSQIDQEQKEYYTRKLGEELSPFVRKYFSLLRRCKKNIDQYRITYQAATSCEFFVQNAVLLLMGLDLMPDDIGMILCELYGNSLAMFHNPCGYIEEKVKQGQRLTANAREVMDTAHQLFEAERRDAVRNCGDLLRSLESRLLNRRSSAKSQASEHNVDELCDQMIKRSASAITLARVTKIQERWSGDKDCRFGRHEACEKIAFKLLTGMSKSYGGSLIGQDSSQSQSGSSDHGSYKSRADDEYREKPKIPSVHGSHSVTSNERIHQRRTNQEDHEDLRDRIHKKSSGSRDHSSHKSRAGDEYHGERRVPSVYGGHSVTGDDRIHQRRTNQEDHDDLRDRLDKKSRSRLEIPNEPRSRCSSKASVKRGDFDQNHSDPRSPGGCEPYNDEKPPDDNEGLGDPDNPDADEARDDKDNPGSGDDSDSDDGSGSGDDSGSDDGQAKEREGNDGQGEEDKGNNGQGEEVEATNAPEEEDEENDVNERL